MNFVESYYYIFRDQAKNLMLDIENCILLRNLNNIDLYSNPDMQKNYDFIKKIIDIHLKSKRRNC